jgi:choline monooxygenase|tara:strand:- start:287 stop:1351 length:1065 start_codon:yes stop_codon:yes gene_type:complete
VLTLPEIIDPDIRKARTLPSAFYTDEGKFEEILEGFAKNWHFAAHKSQLSGKSAVELGHLERMIGESMILTAGDEIRCTSNVCTHRGMLLVDGSCSKNTLQCPYHGRTFGLDGRMKSMPEFEQVEDFPTTQDDLRTFPSLFWKGLVFTGIKPSGMEACLEEMEERIGWLPIETFEHDLSRNRCYEIRANWALYVDNYLEGFHIPFVHNDLNKALDYDNYRTEIFDGGVLQIGIASEGEPTFEIPEGSPDFGLNVAAYYYWIFPGLMLNFYPWGLSVNLVVPLSVDRTRVEYHGFVWDKEFLGKGAGGDLDKVEEEDQYVVEATQRGVSSGSYERGRYSPTKETGVHHFHRMLTS